MTHALAGRKQAPEHIAKRVAACRAKGVYERLSARTVERNKVWAGCKHTEETKKKISDANKGKKNALGVRRSREFRKKLSDYWKAHREQHNFYKHGNGNNERDKDMSTLSYRLWREDVFKRDNWTCQMCGQQGGKLQADHIKPYALYPELRHTVSNGRTLCVRCHRGVTFPKRKAS